MTAPPRHIETIREALECKRPNNESNEGAHSRYEKRVAALAALAELETQQRSHVLALQETYVLLGIGEADNALHALDAYLIKHGIYPSSPVSPEETTP